jgi:hypothetical protein
MRVISLSIEWTMKRRGWMAFRLAQQAIVCAHFTADTNNNNHDMLSLSATMFATGTTASALAAGTAHNAAGGGRHGS